ncbi:hypothetical protein NW762_006786 [Fusarium torreyae]|uniref:Nicotinamide N-methyltransferase n=1 Tax=Fusarium torreyae TaxID=1237075 RepID=A0A9W8VHI5_9HYPO|nr:hypothetical protein NW762_006786 [Fusarium torreyae]
MNQRIASTALGVIFPDDITNQHDDAGHNLTSLSPLSSISPTLLGKMLASCSRITSGTPPFFSPSSSRPACSVFRLRSLGEARDSISFDVKGLEVLELGARTALPSIMAGLLGAKHIVATDYPAEPVLKTLRTNIARNIQPCLSLAAAETTPSGAVSIHGHSWRELEDPISKSGEHAFDRIIASDCLWMPWQHANLHRSITHFLKRTPEARCWVVAGFHTGRQKMSGFYDAAALEEVGPEVERMWEGDCSGEEGVWDIGRDDDITVRKRWLVVASLKWISTS